MKDFFQLSYRKIQRSQLRRIYNYENLQTRNHVLQCHLREKM